MEVRGAARFIAAVVRSERARRRFDRARRVRQRSAPKRRRSRPTARTCAMTRGPDRAPSRRQRAVAGVFDVTFGRPHGARADPGARRRRLRAHARARLDFLRLPINWSAIEPTAARTTRRTSIASTQRSQCAADAGVFVMVDLHQDAYSKEIGEDGAPLWAIVPAPTELLRPADRSRRSPVSLRSRPRSTRSSIPATRPACRQRSATCSSTWPHAGPTPRR